MRIRGIELAKKLKSQRRSSADTQGTSSPSKGTDFGEEMKRQNEVLTQFKGAVNKVMNEIKQQRKSRMAQKKNGFG